jgi:outer membrane receptor protein involved in Fe transport
LEVLMQKSFLLAAAAFALVLQAPIALAQSTPSAGGTAPAATTTTAPAAATTTPPAAATTTAAPSGSTETKTTDKANGQKKTAKKKMTRQQEIDHSVDTGTVPSRYRSSVPKQYQQYIPFDKQ